MFQFSICLIAWDVAIHRMESKSSTPVCHGPEQKHYAIAHNIQLHDIKETMKYLLFNIGLITICVRYISNRICQRRIFHWNRCSCCCRLHHVFTSINVRRFCFQTAKQMWSQTAIHITVSYVRMEKTSTKNEYRNEIKVDAAVCRCLLMISIRRKCSRVSMCLCRACCIVHIACNKPHTRGAHLFYD